MSNKITQIKNIFKSDFLVYLISRYLAYAFQFINSIILLNYLGEIKYGMYGFGLMIISYISYAHLGLNQSVNTILAIKKSKSELCVKIWNTAFSINLVISIALISINYTILLINDNIAIKYQYPSYSYYIIAIGFLTNTNLLFVSLYRIYGKFLKINVSQLLIPGLVLIGAIYFKHHLSLKFVFSSIILAHVISFIIFYYKSPIITKISITVKLFKIIILRGLNLMVYNLSFQLITLAATTLISIFYSAEQLGYFSLSVLLSNALVMIVGSMMFLIYPKLLNKFSNNVNSYIKEILNKIQSHYVLSTDLVTLSAIIIIPIFELYFSKYKPINESLKILILAQLVLNSTSGFSAFLIARKKEAKMTKFGFISVIIVALTGTSINALGGTFSYVSFSVLSGMTVYSILILNEGLKQLEEKPTITEIIKIITLNKIIFIFLVIVSFFIKDNLYLPVIAVIFFYMISLKNIIQLVKTVKFIIQDNSILSF